jgi:hypothetical protein
MGTTTCVPVLARSVRRTTLGVLGSTVLAQGGTTTCGTRPRAVRLGLPPKRAQRSGRVGGGMGSEGGRKETTGWTLLGVLGRVRH